MKTQNSIILGYLNTDGNPITFSYNCTETYFKQPTRSTNNSHKI